MTDKNKNVVNAEEQNRAVNPEGRDLENETTWSQDPGNASASQNETPEKEKPDLGGDVQRPHSVESEDADDMERKSPNL